jgi:predicted O-linked N-acetylglucosamine transferase (SPINDLY family)
MPTIDYYLSAEELEPEHAQDNYTEGLVKLPNLGCAYAALNLEAADPGLEFLDDGVPVLLCAGSHYKYPPVHDRIWAEIARRLERCRVVFFESHLKPLNERMRTRLTRAFEEASAIECLRIIPALPRAGFYGLMRRADLMLDTIGFSGFNTVIQAVECGLPVVTREGRFMRGRLGSGILRRMGMPELIAQDEAEYIDLAVKVARDNDYRESLRQKMKQSRHVLFDDLESVRALETFLLGVARSRPS